ncbi:MAG: hypothetical protein HFE58_12370, partial [Firmicutes bacterium]|nr:hypothetical protein [Bacillota bacterium]
MGIFFTVGENKKRPGVYQRYENVGGVSIAGATDGIVACCIRSNWGERNKVHTFESIEQAIEILGNGGENGTVSLLTEIFTGGAKKVYCVRLGSGGTKGQTTLYDAENAQAVTMTAKSEGAGRIYCWRDGYVSSLLMWRLLGLHIIIISIHRR